VTCLTLRAEYRGAFDWTASIRFLAARAIDGVERVCGETYERTVRIDASTGVLAVTHDPRSESLAVTVTSAAAEGEPVLERVRRMFDLDADLPTINACLARDALLDALRFVWQADGIRSRLRSEPSSGSRSASRGHGS
jgi:3-methyladenine DNA glycosylase/8-oxoguanine DNA glycosylase